MKRHAPAAQRNRDAILDVLRRVLPEHGRVVEIASGSGQHVIHFAQALPGLHFQPSDPSESARASVDAWRADAALPNVAPAIALDAAAAQWPIDKADAVVCINMVHISPWEATLGLLEGAAAVLSDGGVLVLYGPYYVDGQSAPSNVAFDQSLRARDASWGVRELREVEHAAQGRGFTIVSTVAMPANNLTVVFRRRG